MTARTVHFFEPPGKKNTSEVVEAVTKRAEESDIKAVVIASISGKTAIKVA